MSIRRLATHMLVFGAAVAFGHVEAGSLPPERLILVPNFSTTNIMAFSAVDGDPYDLEFIVDSGGNLFTPFDVAEGPIESVLVSEAAFGVVHRYNLLTGDYLGVFAPFGGGDPDILGSAEGMYKFDSTGGSKLLVTSRTGANANAVVEFDGGGNYVGTRVAPGAGGLDGPRDVVARGEPYNDLLVTTGDAAVVHRYDLDGNPMADFVTLSGRMNRIHWNEEGGEVLVVMYDGADEGVNRFNGDGVFINRLDPPGFTNYHGVCPLLNGNYLLSGLDGVIEVDFMGNLVEVETDELGAAARRINVTVSGLIFRDEFETGDLDDWSSSVD